MLSRKKAALALTGFLVLTAAAAGLFVWSGAYNIAATAQHTQPVYTLLEYTMSQSVRLRARSVDVPALHAAGSFERGAVCYREHCQLCHGGPGVAPAEMALGMQPLPGPLADAPRRWRPRELYWLMSNGITMSGMPAWKYRIADGDLWALVTFIERLPALSPSAYRTAVERGSTERCVANDRAGTSADPARGRRALAQYGCNGCHVIPGVTGADVHVGPPLASLARRALIAGELANTQQNLVRWVMDPRSIDPQTAMPALGVAESDARDIAAYLATLH